MTRNGTLYPLPMWVRPTSAKDSGLWPTPTAHSAYDRNTKYCQGGTPLTLAVKIWPTPTVQDSENDAGPSQWKRNSYPLNVEVHQANGRTATTKTGQLNPNWVEWLMGYPPGWTDLED
tara:strand:- start:733 stop:1086 length:354 start_codon:yes stop_codon:yes gene_type:complete